MKTKNKLKCQVCGKEDAVGVASVPGVPVSFAYGRNCLKANAHPWSALVANTACCGGYDNTADWWKEMINDTCNHLGRTLEEFKIAVRMSIADMKAYGDRNDDS